MTRQRLLFWLVLYAALAGGSFMLYSLVLPIRIGWHIIATGAIVVYLWRRGLPDSTITVAVGVMLAAVVLAIPNALDTRMALENAWGWVTNLLLFLCLIQLVRDGYGATLFNSHLAAGALVALVAVVQFLTTGNRPGGLFDNINLTGAYCAALVIPAMHTARTRRQRRYYVLLALLLAAVASSQSRGGFLSVGLGLMVYAAYTAQLSRRVKAVMLGAVGLALAVVIGLTLTGHNAGDRVRTQLWNEAQSLIERYPSGVGPGLFAQAINIEQNRFTGAHNHYLTLAAELGGWGLAAGSLLLLIWLGAFLDQSQWDGQQIAYAAALAGVAVHLLFDNYPSSNWALLVGFYAASIAYERRLNIPTVIKQFWGLGAALVVLGWGALALNYDRAESFYVDYLTTGREYDLYTAIDLDPDNRLYNLEAQRLQGHVVDLTPMAALTKYGRPYHD